VINLAEKESSMRLIQCAVLATGMFAAAAVFAQSGADVVKAKGCLGCHAVDAKKMGPSFKAIAAKDQGKEAALVAKLKDGKGHPKIAASDAELKAAIGYVLSQK
jgi:cytochrome c